MTTTLRFEQEALTQLPALRRYAESLTRDPHRSDDLVQDTMLKALRYSHTYQEGTNCRAWLFQICKHSFINEYRRRQYEPVSVDFQDLLTQHLQDGREDYGVHPVMTDLSSMQDDAAMIGDEVARALERLPADYQTVLLLNDLEDYTYDEIASFVGIPIGTVRSRIHRARKMLRERLEDYARSRGYRAGNVRKPA